MTSAEKAKHIIEHNGICSAIMCDNDDPNSCPCAINCTRGLSDSAKENTDAVEICKQFLLEHDTASTPEKETVTGISIWPTAEDTQTVKEAADKLLALGAEEASTLPLYTDTQQNMGHVLDSMKDLLIYKNTKYGNSALEPMDVFTRHLSDDNSVGLNSILVRLDDKLKRIQNAEDLRKNDVSDLIGYLTLLCVDQEWTDFSEFKD